MGTTFYIETTKPKVLPRTLIPQVRTKPMDNLSTTDSVQSNSIEVTAAPSISKLLGVVPILPGESADLYQASLDTLIEELGARSVLQVYLADKIHDCLWWMRRYVLLGT